MTPDFFDRDFENQSGLKNLFSTSQKGHGCRPGTLPLKSEEKSKFSMIKTN